VRLTYCLVYVPGPVALHVVLVAVLSMVEVPFDEMVRCDKTSR